MEDQNLPLNSLWKPTMELRWIRKPYTPMVLQQKWVDVKGKEQWYDVPVVIEKQKEDS